MSGVKSPYFFFAVYSSKQVDICWLPEKLNVMDPNGEHLV